MCVCVYTRRRMPVLPTGSLLHPVHRHVICIAPSSAVAPNSAVPAPNIAVPAPNNAVPAPNSAMPAPNSAVPAPNNAVPAPNNAVPAPNSAVPAPNSAVSAPNSANGHASVTPPVECRLTGALPDFGQNGPPLFAAKVALHRHPGPLNVHPGVNVRPVECHLPALRRG